MGGEIVRCSTCSQVRLNPQPDSEALTKISETLEDPIYLDQLPSSCKTFEIALGKMDRQFPVDDRSTYLDLSCYYGAFVETLFELNRHAVGVDICPEVIEQGNTRLGRGSLYSGRVENWPSLFQGKRFDRVTSWDAIEHVPNPVEYLQVAQKLLADDGLLVLSTMNWDSMVAKIMGRRWPWIMPMHLWYFSPQTIETVLNRAGLRPIHIETYTHVVTLGYLAYKIFPRIFRKPIDHWLLNRMFIRVNLRDFMTIYACHFSRR
jgi:2-polyprenyl-3-methyl-5-hydroxy-6-metoxy-1,4-benzoquinol methylase